MPAWPQTRNRFFFVLVVSATYLRIALAEEPLPPPIRGPLVPASSFGEYRSAHYHGGLDFSTGGREGMPVEAPRGGWIYRVRASGIGYGRSVYLRLEDGRTLVFAHLSRFEPRLAAYVDSAQDRAGRYEVDLYPEAGTFTYAAGDTLAFTGQSGAGPPHLHAEVRTGKEASLAQNPWTHGWAPPDSLPPRLARLRVAPAVPGVLVMGGLDPIVLPLPESKTQEIRITGPVRMWVETWDPVRTGARMAPYRVSAHVDDEVIAEVVFDAVDWNWAREVNWTYYAPSARKGETMWIALDPPPGGRQRVHRIDKDWVDDLDPGTHRLVLESADGSANVTRRTVTLVKEERGTKTPAGVVRKPSIASRGGYLDIRMPGATPFITARDAEGRSVTPEATAMQGGALFQVATLPHPGAWTFFSGDSLLARALWLPGAASPWPWKRDRDSVTVEHEDVRVGGKSDAGYGPLWILVSDTPALPAPELEPVTRALVLEPRATPLRNDISVVCAVPGLRHRRNLAIMRRDESGWSYVGADTTGPGLRARLGALETIAVFRDRTAPGIRIQPVTGGRRPRLRAAISEKGVGVSLPDLHCVLDGANVIAEWDPDAGMLTAHLRPALTPGPHEVVFVASDRVGNVSRARLAFTIR